MREATIVPLPGAGAIEVSIHASHAGGDVDHFR